MGKLEVNEFTAAMMKYDKMEQLSGRVPTASGGRTILFSVLLGHLHSIGLSCTMAKRY